MTTDKLIEKLRLGALCKEMPEAADLIERQAAELERLREDMQFIERWAVHHGSKPHCTPAEALSVIQHYPPIAAITKSYAAPAQQAEPTRSERMRAAGHEPRDTRMACEECGQKVSAQLLLAHKCQSLTVGAGPVKLEDIEQYRMQMAAISTAALGYWKESDGILPDYDTVPLRDVAKLYAKYDELYRMRVEAQANPPQPAAQAEPVILDGTLLEPLTEEQVFRALKAAGPINRSTVRTLARYWQTHPVNRSSNPPAQWRDTITSTTESTS